MKIVATCESKSVLAEITIAVLTVAAIATFAMKVAPPMVSAVLAAAALLLAYNYYTRDLILVLDEDGIFDARLGVDKIMWRDVIDVKIEMCFRKRYLSLVVRNQYDGAHTFHVDLSEINVNLLTLQSFIKRRTAV